MIRALFCVLGFAAAVVDARADDQVGAKVNGRVVEGKVVAAGNKRAQGRAVLFGPPPVSMVLVEGVTATTDAQGLYRADLARFPWSTGTIQAFVLEPGYKAAERKIDPGTGTARADFELVPEPWKETQIRMEDSSGKPAAGEVVTSSVGGMIWARVKTDALGCCRIAIPQYLRVRLSTEPRNGRPIEAYFAGTKEDPASITLPVLPAIQGRVLDPEGWPVPNAAVGWHLSFESDGTGEMLPFFGGALAVTDRGGNFVITPTLEVRLYRSRPTPKLAALCFAGPSVRSLCYQLFDRNQPIRMAYQLFDPNRPTEPMHVTLKPSRRVRIPISRGFVTSGRQTEFDSEIWITPRTDIPDWRFFLITRSLTPKEGSTTQAEETVLEEYLPEGTYQVEVNLRDPNTDARLGKARREIVVPRGEGTLDLPPLAIEPMDFQKLAGKPAPEIDATHLDSGRPVKLADFRGKVVLLEFWGYWCGPCVANMPFLAELHRKFQGRPLAILALHDQSVQSRAVYDRKTTTARQRIWSGRDLPFPVLLDRPDPKKPDDLDPEGTGTTIVRYGITGFPTLFVIDRDGTMIGRVDPTDHVRLESVVRELVKKAEGR